MVINSVLRRLRRYVWSCETWLSKLGYTLKLVDDEFVKRAMSAILSLMSNTLYSHFVVHVHCRCLIIIVGLAASPYRPL